MPGSPLSRWSGDWMSGAPLHREQWLDVRITTVQMELWLDVHTRCRGLIECDCGVSTLGWFRIFQIFKAVKLTTLNGTAFWKHVAFVKMQQLHFFMRDKWSKMGKKWVHVWKKNYSWVSTDGGRDGFQWMGPRENALNVLDFYLQLAGSIKNVFLNGSSV